MAPVLLVAGGGEGGEGERSGMRPLLLIDRPDTPAGFHAPPPVDDEDEDDFEDEEGDAMAGTGTNKKRIEELEVKIESISKATDEIPEIKNMVKSCTDNTKSMMLFMQTQWGMPTPPTDSATGPAIPAPASPSIDVLGAGIGHALATSTGNQAWRLVGPGVKFARENSWFVMMAGLIYVAFFK